MRKTLYQLLLTLIGLQLVGSLKAITPEEYRIRLYYTCKVWGYVKYHHPEVRQCKVDWDQELSRILPLVKNTTNRDSFNLVLMSLLNAAGPVIPPVVPKVNVPDSLQINTSSEWMHSPVFSDSVVSWMDTLVSRFRPGQSCWVKPNDNSNPNNKGWLIFPGERVDNIGAVYPDEATRLLQLFRYWNIIYYFNPNNRLMTIPWDSTLMHAVLPIATAANANQYHLAMAHGISGMDDTHAVFSSGQWYSMLGLNYLPVQLSYIENQYVVTRTFGTNLLKRGDVITAIGDKPILYLVDSLKAYLSSSNPASMYRDLASWIIRRPGNIQLKIDGYNDNGSFTKWIYTSMSSTAYSDSIRKVSDSTVRVLPGCGYAMINMGLLQQVQINELYDSICRFPGIVFDLRNYPNGTGWQLMNLIQPDNFPFVRIQEPNTQYPGTLYNDQFISLGVNGNQQAFKGKIFVLVNEQTQSQAEYTTMMFQSYANTTVIGSQTAGADGNVTFLYDYTKPFYTLFSTLKILYPDGYDTQRNGVRIDSVVRPTINGLRENRDELLEAVYAKINSGLPQTHPVSVSIFPNPSDGFIHIRLQGGEVLHFELTDVLGRLYPVTLSQSGADLVADCSELRQGYYFLRINDSMNRILIRK